MNPVSRIAKALGLPDSGQDWGIEHADASRLEEFVAYAETHEPSHPWEFEALAELIIQSAEEALSTGPLPADLQVRLVSLLRNRAHQFPAMLAQWRTYSPQDGWRFLALLPTSQSGA